MRKFFKIKEKNNEFYSMLKVSGVFDIDTFLNRKNLTMIKSTSNYIENHISYDECLFETSAGFYLYLINMDSKDSYKLSFYYKEEQLNEVKIFLNQLIKKQNERNNNN
jgi:hypothetical protein